MMEVRDANLVINEYASMLSQTQKELVLLRAYCTELLRDKKDVEERLAVVESEIARLRPVEIIDNAPQQV